MALWGRNAENLRVIEFLFKWVAYKLFLSIWKITFKVTLFILSSHTLTYSTCVKYGEKTLASACVRTKREQTVAVAQQVACWTNGWLCSIFTVKDKCRIDNANGLEGGCTLDWSGTMIRKARTPHTVQNFQIKAISCIYGRLWVLSCTPIRLTFAKSRLMRIIVRHSNRSYIQLTAHAYRAMLIFCWDHYADGIERRTKGNKLFIGGGWSQPIWCVSLAQNRFTKVRPAIANECKQ